MKMPNKKRLIVQRLVPKYLPGEQRERIGRDTAVWCPEREKYVSTLQCHFCSQFQAWTKEEGNNNDTKLCRYKHDENIRSGLHGLQSQGDSTKEAWAGIEEEREENRKLLVRIKEEREALEKVRLETEAAIEESKRAMNEYLSMLETNKKEDATEDNTEEEYEKPVEPEKEENLSRDDGEEENDVDVYYNW